MANTTNYNWETPDDTDLVKDGAAAIRTLGSSVDTTTKALNPSTTLGDIEYRSATANTNTRLAIGTTGQVLSVVGGVPAWATSDDANAIQNAIVDAKGDIVAASAADTPARLAVGTDNQRLVAASGEATGLKYVSDTQNTVIDAAGDLLYGTAADTVAKLGIGTAGQILRVNSGATAPEWATAASSGGMTLIQETAASALSSLSFTSISGSYKQLLLVWSGIQHSATGNEFAIRLNNDSNSIYNSSGFYASWPGSYSNEGFSRTSLSLTDFMPFGKNCDLNNTATRAAGVLLIDNYASSTKTKTWSLKFNYYDRAADIYRALDRVGYFNSTTAITTVDIVRLAGSGTFSNEQDTTIRLYGVS